jgi:hypothetical protein
MCLVKSFFIVSQTAKKAEAPVRIETEKRRDEDNSDFMPKTKENDYN